MLSAALGVADVHMALGPGERTVKRRPMLQVMRADGEVVAFAGLGVSPAAERVMQAAAVVLGWLRDIPELAGAVPVQRALERVDGMLVSIISPGPTAPSPRHYGRPHVEFLQALEARTRATRPFATSHFWRELTSRYDSIRVSAPWRERLDSSMRRLLQAFGETPTALHAAHRDFTRWNSRIYPDGRLFVYDWEHATTDAPPLYDLFNFHMETARTVHDLLGAAARWRPDVSDTAVRRSLLAFLVDFSVRVFALRAEPRLLRAGAMLDAQSEWMPAIR